MRGSAGRFQITSKWEDLKTLLPEVIFAADKERASFGFLPHPAYRTVAIEGRLIIAKSCDDGKLLGYVIVGGTFPQARIFQTYVEASARRTGVGQALVNEVVSRSAAASFLSIRAEVAEDLVEANRFYRNLGFKAVRKKKGGATTKRVIITRVRELPTPSLLDLATYGTTKGPPVRLRVPTRTKPPLYLLDLNVLFDVTRHRGNAAAGRQILAAALDNSIALAVSEEFIEELERNAVEGSSDPILDFARELPRLRKPPTPFLLQMRAALGPLFFPGRWPDRLTVQDDSDIVHVATAIYEESKGFVTSEKAILRCSSQLRDQYGLDVISPVSLGKYYTAAARQSEGYRVQFDNRQVSCARTVDADLPAVELLLQSQEIPEHVRRKALGSGSSVSPRRRVSVICDERLIAFASWDVPKPAEVDRKIYIFAEQTDLAADLAVGFLINEALRDSIEDEPSVLRLSPSADDMVVRSVAIKFGFRPEAGSSPRAGKLEKVCLGAVVTRDNWAAIRSALERKVGITLPGNPPDFGSPTDEVRVMSGEGSYASISIEDLEDLLSPTIFALEARPAVIVPIKPDYAENLFRGSSQLSLLEGAQAGLLNEKRYFSAAQTYRKIPESGVIVFYESGGQGRQRGRSAAIAVGRIRRRYLADELVAKGLSRQKGVLTGRAINTMAQGKEVCVTEFDSVRLLKCAVPLRELKRLGAADDANLVSAKRLDRGVVRQLLAKGMKGA